MRVLVIGDTHIPDRASHVPVELMEIIDGGRPWDIVVFTGDLTGENVLRWVRNLGREVYVVRGNMDYLPLPKTRSFEINGVRAGVHHGDGVYPRGEVGQLTRIADRLGVAVLFSGHTHNPFIKVSRDSRVLHVNPGSLTGAWGGGDYLDAACMGVVEASDDGCLDITVYCLIGGSVKNYLHARYCRRGRGWEKLS